MEVPQDPPVGGDRDRSPALTIMVIVVMSMTIPVVSLRMVTRKFLTRNVGWDDWTIVLAEIGSIIGAAIDIPEIQSGFGKHHYYLSEHQYQEFKKYSYFEWIQTFWTLMFTKISICLLLLRVVVDKPTVRSIQTLIAVLVLSHVIITFVYIFQCLPVDAAWTPTRPQNRCFSNGQVERIIMSHAIISVVSDFILAGFPILILRKVKIGMRTKVALCCLMGLGVITGSACIVRTVNNWQNGGDDLSWTAVDNFMWRSIEVNLGIVLASAPALLPLWRLFANKKWTQPRSSGESPGSDKRLYRHIEGRQINPPPKAHEPEGRHSGEEFSLPLQGLEPRGYRNSAETEIERKMGSWGMDGRSQCCG
ncbi:hypothetical protein MMC20_005184 [Loxospora ochrophaea]|nr:hypothetical protein [Loxospora ochrophaea]